MVMTYRESRVLSRSESGPECEIKLSLPDLKTKGDAGPPLPSLTHADILPIPRPPTLSPYQHRASLSSLHDRLLDLGSDRTASCMSHRDSED